VLTVKYLQASISVSCYHVHWLHVACVRSSASGHGNTQFCFIGCESVEFPVLLHTKTSSIGRQSMPITRFNLAESTWRESDECFILYMIKINFVEM